MRLPVQFASAVRAAIQPQSSEPQSTDTRPTIALEVGPHPVLATDLRQLLGRDDATGTVLASMERARDGRDVALASLGALYVAGYPLDHTRRSSRPRPSVPLPTYAWHRKRYWLAGARAGKPNTRVEGQALDGYAILGRKFTSLRASGEKYFEVDLGPEDHPELFRHRIEGVPLFPASAAVEMTLVSARQEIKENSFTVRDFSSPHDLVLQEDQRVTLQMVVTPDGDGGYAAELLAARPGQGTSPLATASLVPDQVVKEPPPPKEPRARSRPGWTKNSRPTKCRDEEPGRRLAAQPYCKSARGRDRARPWPCSVSRTRYPHLRAFM